MIAAAVAGGAQHSDDTVVELLDQPSAGPQRALATGARSDSRRAVSALRSPVEKE